MKFDTPAIDKPIDQLEIIGHATSRIDGPSRRRGGQPTPMNGTTPSSRPAYGYIVGSAIAGAQDRIDRLVPRQGRAGRISIVTAEECRGARQGQPARQSCSAAQRSTSIITRPSRSSPAEDLRAGRAHAAARPGRLQRGEGLFDLSAGRDGAAKPPVAAGQPAGQRVTAIFRAPSPPRRCKLDATAPR